MDPFQYVPNPGNTGSPEWPTNSNLGSYYALSTILLNLMLGVSITVSVMGFIMAGIKYTTAKGDFKAVASAQKTLTYAVVGFVVAALAYAIKLIVLRILGVGNPGLLNTPTTI